MNAEEAARIEPIFERLHPLADDVAFVARVDLSVGTARQDVIDRLDRHDPYLTPHLHSETLEILRHLLPLRIRPGILPRGGTRCHPQ